MNSAQVAASTVLGAFALYSATRSSAASGKTSKKDRSSKRFEENSESASSISSVSDSVETPARKSFFKSNRHGAETKFGSQLNSVVDVAVESSDIVFDMTSGLVVGKSSESPKLVSLESTTGSADMIVGAASNSSTNVSVVVTSEDLMLNLDALRNVSENNIPVVWNVSCSGVDNDTLKIFTDYSVAASMNFPILVASTAQETYDFAVLAHALRKSTNTPVGVCFDGESAVSQETSINVIKKLNAGSSVRGMAIGEALKQISSGVLKKEFTPFEYIGSPSADTLIISYGAVSQLFVELVEQSQEIGLLNVKLLKPFKANDLLESIPKSIQRICVVEHTPGDVKLLFSEVAGIACSAAAGKLFSKSGGNQFFPTVFCTKIDSREVDDIDLQIASLVMGNAMSSSVNTQLVVGTEVIEAFKSKMSFHATYGSLGSFAGTSQAGSAYVALDRRTEISLWLDEENSDEILSLNSLNKKFKGVQVTRKVDTVSDIERIDLRLSSSQEGSEFPCFGITSADVVVVSMSSAVLPVAGQSVKPGGSLVLLGDESNFKFDANLLDENLKAWLHQTNTTVYFLKLNENESASPDTMLEVAMLIPSAAYGSEQSKANPLNARLEHINTFALRQSFKVQNGKKNEEKNINKSFISRRRSRSTIGKTMQIIDPNVPLPAYQSAWSVLFKESFNVKNALRPADHGVSTAIVSKFERLTPDEYNRNIFHVEFDISGTDIKYQIGDALGVFGENDEKKVDEFISEYGLDGNEIVKLPPRGGMHGACCEYVSVRNLLVKNLDIFGKVPKRFYVELAKFATSRYEKLKLLHTGTDDAEWFKLGIYETVTPAELLLQYKSCKLNIYDIIRLVPEIKARHYSISSSMKMSPKSVHLLVVAVDWTTPLGKFAEGQCTRFLRTLKVGQKVSVDIQNSVLRLPPDPRQPIVMAGLGTGMAPFRAFIQQRYFQKRLGMEVGPMVLYFGARHKAQEWLYGEELEKYEEMGLLKLGLAWSRDQSHKVYIQHKIKEDAKLLKDYLETKKGYFYLCGPTWPVPDVRDAINEGLLSEEAVEVLKEDGRYILEVY